MRNRAVGSGLNQVDHDVDMAACRFGVHARLMCFIRQSLSDLPLHARQADAKASPKEVGAVSQTQIDFGLNGQAYWDSTRPLAGYNRDRAFEAGRPGGREELLRIGADTRGARSSYDRAAAIRQSGPGPRIKCLLQRHIRDPRIVRACS